MAGMRFPAYEESLNRDDKKKLTNPDTMIRDDKLIGTFKVGKLKPYKHRLF